MLSLTIPKVLSNGWFWLAIVAVGITVNYFWGKSPPPPRKSAFFEKHKRAITRTTDIFLILVILLVWVPLIYMSLSMSIGSILKYTHIPTKILVTDSVAFFAIGATALSCGSGVLFGLLSVFQSNLTRNKRLILSVVSILPICFTILAVMSAPFDNPETIWSTVKIGLAALITCWIFNGPAIIMGKHSLRVGWDIMRKLRLVSGDYPG